jgi:hypothetical protein
MTDKKLFNFEDVKDRIADTFSGMDEEYEQLIRAHHTDYLNPKYSDEAKRESRRDALNAARDLVVLRCDKALAACANIQDEYTAAPAGVSKSDTQRMSDLMLWSNTLKTKDLRELEALWSEHAGDTDLKELMVAELRGRDRTPAQRQLLNQIENGGPTAAFPDLDRAETALGFYKSTAQDGKYPHGMVESINTAFKQSAKYRQVAKDLDAFPADGAVYRPVFRLSVMP